MYIFWRKYKGKKARYAALYEPTGEKGLPKMVFYLGKDPEAKLRKLLTEGKLTPEQVARITSPEAAALVEEVKQKLSSTWCEKAKDHCTLKKVKEIMALYGDEPSGAVEKIKEVLNNG